LRADLGAEVVWPVGYRRAEPDRGADQRAEEGMTMMIVTHEIGFAPEVADTVVFLDAGVVVASGDARALIADARHERTRAFLSKVL
jgi:polar amino acid transport system ATP-binding protein